MLPTLQRSGNELASPAKQLAVLGDAQLVAEGKFDSRIREFGVTELRSNKLTTLQINVGRVCNQVCSHCHVDAGPDRKEKMSREVAEHIIRFLENSDIETLDITGGAPEMNSNFRWFVEQATALGRKTIDRCNLTILLANGFTDLPEFLAKHKTQIVASLPCYLEENCDAQRGDGTFVKSIKAIRRLNELGYGIAGSGLELDLVYNPVGIGLPPDQQSLESKYRSELRERYQIEFNSLFTITNMPISRYLDELLAESNYMEYMEKLLASFNPANIDSLMCRTMVSVDYEGYLYDCDFNQMLLMKIDPERRQHISEVTAADLENRLIQTANHCFGCTAGTGSSCTGSLESGCQ